MAAADSFLSRSGNGSPLGKRTATVRAQVSEATKERLEILWREAGYSSESEFIATLLDVHCFGEDEIQRLHAERISAVARKRQVND